MFDCLNFKIKRLANFYRSTVVLGFCSLNFFQTGLNLCPVLFGIVQGCITVYLSRF